MSTYLDVSGVITAIQGALIILVAVLLAVTQVTGRRRPRKRAVQVDSALPLFFTRVPTADEIGAEAEQMLREYGNG